MNSLQGQSTEMHLEHLTPYSDSPKVSIVLLDWNCRESFHSLDYLAEQTVPRDQYEIIWIEYYQRVPAGIRDRYTAAKSKGQRPPIDQHIVLNMPANVYYHKQLMYNVGIVNSRGKIVVICDSDAMFAKTFVRTIIEEFERDPRIVLHLDEVRNKNQDFYPFRYPKIEEVLGYGAINWRDGKTTGLWAREDAIHARNYGACMCAQREHLIAIGGADEHIDYLGHICGPYELTFRLMNFGMREIWHETEYIYHVWHPGQDGEMNYFGPSDGKGMSSTALEVLNTGRVMPLVENAVVEKLRSGMPLQAALQAAPLVDPAYPQRWVHEALIDSGRLKLWDSKRHNLPLEIWKGYNILSQGDGTVCGLPVALGSVDLSAPTSRNDPRIVWAADVTALKTQLRDAPACHPTPTEMGEHGDFRIVAYNADYYGVPKWYGGLRLEAALRLPHQPIVQGKTHNALASALGTGHSCVISVIVPTRRRTEQLRAMLDSLRETTRHPERLEVVLVVDRDDVESRAFRHAGLALKHVTVEPGLTMGALISAGYREASGYYLLLLNDDVIVRTPGWDDAVLTAFRSFPDGVALVHVNDTLFKGNLCIFPFVTRVYAELAGGVCEAGYLRYRIDDHIQNVFDLLATLGSRRIAYLPEVVFEHTNHNTDKLGREVYSPDQETHAEDSKLFSRLLPERRRLAGLLLEHMARVAEMERTLHQEALLARIVDSTTVRVPSHARVLSSSHHLTSSATRVTVAILTEDAQSDHARACLDQVRRYTKNYEVFIVDRAGLQAFNPAREINRLLHGTPCEYVVFLDERVLVQFGWLESLLHCMTPTVGMVVPVLRSADRRYSAEGIVLQPDGSGHYSRVFDVNRGVRRVQTAGGEAFLLDLAKCRHIQMDERCIGPFAGLDLGLKVWEAGFEVVCNPSAQALLLGRPDHPGMELAGPSYDLARATFADIWMESGRYADLEQGIWATVADLQEVRGLASTLEELVRQRPRDSFASFTSRSRETVAAAASYPALLDWMEGLAGQALAVSPAERTGPGENHLRHLVALCQELRPSREAFQGSVHEGLDLAGGMYLSPRQPAPHGPTASVFPNSSPNMATASTAPATPADERRLWALLKLVLFPLTMWMPLVRLRNERGSWRAALRGGAKLALRTVVLALFGAGVLRRARSLRGLTAFARLQAGSMGGAVVWLAKFALRWRFPRIAIPWAR